MLRAKKHVEIFVVDGFREGNGVEVTLKNEDYVPNPSEMSSDENNLVKVEVNSGISEDYSECEAIRFDDSVEDGGHENYFVMMMEEERTYNPMKQGTQMLLV